MTFILLLYNEIGLYSIHMTYNHTQILKKREMTMSYIRLERDNSKPRRGSFLNYFWTSSILYTCILFLYWAAISISTSETQGKLTQYQHHRKKNNQKILHPVDQKQHGKVIQRRGGARNKLSEKGMKTPSSLVAHLPAI